MVLTWTQLPVFYHLKKVRRNYHVENAAAGHPWDHSGACRPAAPGGLQPGVMTNGRKAIQDKALSVLVAAVAALLCAVIDHLTKEEHP